MVTSSSSSISQSSTKMMEINYRVPGCVFSYMVVFAVSETSCSVGEAGRY